MGVINVEGEPPGTNSMYSVKSTVRVVHVASCDTLTGYITVFFFTGCITISFSACFNRLFQCVNM